MISAVNGDLWLDNIGCFRYRVKLNNPLMGTEINLRYYRFRKSRLYNVKLNNPLMGTEINFHPDIVYRFYGRTPVKLNNPLMGTEICFNLFFTKPHAAYIRLN